MSDIAHNRSWRSRIYEGRVGHERLRPVRHKFSYRVFSLLIELDEIEDLSKRMRWLSRGRFNLFSFRDRDYGDEKSSDLASYVRALLRDNDIDGRGRIQLLCYPRMLGYAFNPLAVFYCHDAGGALSAIIYEVRNTFGGKHSYLIPVEQGGLIRQQADKAFHVSPFMEMETRYHFTLTPPAEHINVAIKQTDDEGAKFHATFVGEAREISDKALFRLFFRYPLMTLKVILGIHWEAARLMLKGMRLLPGAPDPANPVTVIRMPSQKAKAA